MASPTSSSKRLFALLSRTAAMVVFPQEQCFQPFRPPNPPMQRRDQAKTVHGATSKMRISACLAALALQEIRIFRMLLDIGFDERALGDHLQSPGAHLV